MKGGGKRRGEKKDCPHLQYPKGGGGGKGGRGNVNCLTFAHEREKGGIFPFYLPRKENDE